MGSYILLYRDYVTNYFLFNIKCVQYSKTVPTSEEERYNRKENVRQKVLFIVSGFMTS